MMIGTGRGRGWKWHASSDVMMKLVSPLIDKALALAPPTRQEALSVLAVPDEDTPLLAALVGKVRTAYFGRRVKLNFLVNVKSGLCPEDCHYCSQAKGSQAPIPRYPMLAPAQILEAASTAVAGLSPCSGALFGMGETDEDIVEVAFALRSLNPDSVPINFLIPFQGTPLGERSELTPYRCLRILALFRLVFPNVEVRIAGGREIHLRSLQPLGLMLANSRSEERRVGKECRSR